MLLVSSGLLYGLTGVRVSIGMDGQNLQPRSEVSRFGAGPSAAHWIAERLG